MSYIIFERYEWLDLLKSKKKVYALLDRKSL